MRKQVYKNEIGGCGIQRMIMDISLLKNLIILQRGLEIGVSGDEELADSFTACLEIRKEWNG